MEIIFKRTSQRIKKPKHLARNVFILYSPKRVLVEPPDAAKIDTKKIILLPNNSKGFVTSKFRGDEIYRFSAKKQRLCVEILNQSYEDTSEIENRSVLGFVVIEPEHLPHKHETKKQKQKIIP